VQNSELSAPQGEIVLVAGKSVGARFEGSPFVTVRITADSSRRLKWDS